MTNRPPRDLKESSLDFSPTDLQSVRVIRIGDALTLRIERLGTTITAESMSVRCSLLDARGRLVRQGETHMRAAHTPHSITQTSPPLALFDPEGRLREWVKSLAIDSPLPCAVVHPCDESSLRGAIEARDAGLIEPILIAPEARLLALAQPLGLSLAGIDRVNSAHSHDSATRAAALASEGKVAMIMKGSLHTDELMEAVLAEPRLRTERRMSHVFRFEVPSYERPLLVTDAAINIRPTLSDKADIARNAILLAHALGIAQPRLAILSAVETVTPKLLSTIDAAALCKMADRGQITGALIDGPLAFDNAISPAAATIKGIASPVAGRADILLVPDLEAGNILAKQLDYLAGAAGCGVVLGARVPILLTSRAEPSIARVASAALGHAVIRHQADRR